MAVERQDRDGSEDGVKHSVSAEAVLSVVEVADHASEQADRLYAELFAALDDASCPKTLACFGSLEELQDQRSRLLRRAMADGVCLYEEPIPESFDCEFYLERDMDDTL